MYHEAIKIIIVTSVLYVWVVRYHNIVSEFAAYKLPEWLRDLVGILKISFSLMIFSNDINIVYLGLIGIILLMSCAQVVHFKNKTQLSKRIPSITLIVLSAIVIVYH